MQRRQTINTMKKKNDIRFVLFNSYLVIISFLGFIFGGLNALNRRPMVNVVTGLAVSLFCVGLFLLSKKFDKYNMARLIFLFLVTFIYIPFGYWTSPGSQSAMIYLVILTVFMLSFTAVKTYEYLFPIAVIIETVILLQTEISFPNHYYKYTDAAYRIEDLTLNFIVVVTAIVLTIAFVSYRFNIYSDELYKISTTDGLTGLYNRRYFTDFMLAEYNLSLKTNQPFSMVILDLNNFKKVNDQYGHPRGDKVLQDIASILKDHLRHYDIAARTGGDEFVMILPSTSQQEASLIVSKMEEDFHEYSENYKDIGFSVAFGIADSKDKSLDELYHISDQHLYDMKVVQKKESS